METTEAQAFRRRQGPAAGLTYDGFVSYSHAADDRLAPRLQAGLERFAKPWWRRRALHVFHDNSSLAANPHLWASITDALDASAWFILLLSPAAATSEWVNREVEYWLEHKDRGRIIPVLTEGMYRWEGGQIVSNAAPPALLDTFSDQPRWVDMRFAADEERLDLHSARFRAAIADIAAPIRGIPKDELESEELRQHRRTIRTALGAAIILLILALSAIVVAIYAAGQRDLAERNERTAVQFAAQLIDYVRQRDVTAIPDVTGALIGDSSQATMSSSGGPPDSARLDFLQENCDEVDALFNPLDCFRDASFVHPELPLRTWVWHAHEPFHIRHGFAADASAETPARDATVRVYIRRDEGPELEDQSFSIGRWYRFSADNVIRETADRCGPGYQFQLEQQLCDTYVHDFPDGLPPGRYTFFVEWRAPCKYWVAADVCDRPDQTLSMFDSQLQSPFLHDDYTADGIFPWPRDLWEDADPIR